MRNKGSLLHKGIIEFSFLKCRVFKVLSCKTMYSPRGMVPGLALLEAHSPGARPFNFCSTIFPLSVTSTSSASTSSRPSWISWAMINRMLFDSRCSEGGRESRALFLLTTRLSLLLFLSWILLLSVSGSSLASSYLKLIEVT